LGGGNSLTGFQGKSVINFGQWDKVLHGGLVGGGTKAQIIPAFGEGEQRRGGRQRVDGQEGSNRIGGRPAVFQEFEVGNQAVGTGKAVAS
jgi:hypothetical protein